MTNKIILLLGLVFAIPFLCFSQKKINVNLQNIPKEALVARHVVSVEKSKEIEIIDQSILLDKKSELYLVLDEIGMKSLDLSVYYDKLTKIKSLECKIYDANGSLIQQYKEKDFKDVSIADGFSIFTDDRIKYLNISNFKFPFFIKYDVITEKNNTITIPSYFPLNIANEYVIKSNFSLIYPDDFQIKKHSKNLEAFNVKITESKGKISYEASDLKSPVYEDLNFDYFGLFPQAKFSNNKIALAGVKGDLNSWDDFGKWYYENFLLDNEELTKETISKIKDITSKATTDIEKAKIIFEYVQNNTRYISVQIGLGGWKPFSAKQVDQLGYGDCKALTNFTRVLLKNVGVDSFYTIIHADDNVVNIDENIISLQGNHVILTVPTLEGNVFLECTSQKIPFGFLGTSTINRRALAVKPEGAYLVQTKSLDDNLLKANFTIDLNDLKRVQTSVNFINKGIFYNDIYSLNVLDKREVSNYLKNLFVGVKEMKTLDFQIENDKDSHSFIENIQIESDFIGSKMGNDYMLNINPFLRTPQVPKAYSKRTTPFKVNRKIIYDINTTYLIPEGFNVSGLPDSKVIDSPFGILDIQISYQEKKIVIKEKILLNSGEFSKEDYESYRTFLKEISLNNNTKFILTKL